MIKPKITVSQSQTPPPAAIFTSRSPRLCATLKTLRNDKCLCGNYFICLNDNASEARSSHESIVQNDDIVADSSKLPRSNQVPTEYLLFNGCHHTDLRNLLPEVALHSYLILDCWKFDDWYYDWTQPRGSWPHLMRPLGLPAIGGSGTTHTPVVIATIFGTSFGGFRYLGPTPHSASWFS